MQLSPNQSKTWLSVCLILSGACALVYEIAWLRLLALSLGNQAYATSCVLAVFLGGLAAGAYFGGKIADRKGAELKHYGAVELGIGLLAPATTLLLRELPMLMSWFWKSMHIAQDFGVILAVDVTISALVLLPPTMLMGATLPIVIKCIQKLNHQSDWFTRLYAVNTGGALIGTMIAGMLGFAYIGILATTLVAGVLNVLIGCANIFFGNHVIAAESPVETETKDGSAIATASIRALSMVSLLIGFCSVSYEVLWTRLLRFYTGSLTYAFSMMLGTFLLGLTLGGFLYEYRYSRQDNTDADRWNRLANLGFLGALACAGSLIAVPIALVIRNQFNVPSPFENPFPSAVMFATICGAIMLLPTILLGTLFPILGTMAARARNAASAVGASYAANTIGCVLGALCSGLILVPAFGSYRTFQIIILMSCLTAAISAFMAGQRGKKFLALGGTSIVFGIAFLAFVNIPYSTFLTVVNGRIEKAGEDAHGSMLVLDFPKADMKTLLLNGSSLATTGMPSRRYMRLLGHLPVLLHENPKEIMVACFGTGTTCGAAAVQPEIETVRLVELSPMIVGAGDCFAASNHSVLHSPKLKKSLTDARNYLLTTQDKFDAITFEPPPPCDVGIVSLYTTDFYRLALSHLRPGGIMCQWVPLHEASEPLWKMQVQSALQVFPYVSLWLPNSGEALLVCSDRRPNYDINNIDRRMHADKALEASLQEVGFDDGADLLAAFVCDGDVLKKYIGDAPVITDYRPALEFFHPYTGKMIPDDSVYNIGKDQSPIQGTDQRLEIARKALRAKTVKEALELRPNNHWFQWVSKN